MKPVVITGLVVNILTPTAIIAPLTISTAFLLSFIECYSQTILNEPALLQKPIPTYTIF